METTKVILLNGFAGSGKTTLARKYIDAHPLSMVIEGDELIANIGDWLDNEDTARSLVFSLTKNMISTAVKSGHDVVVPFLVTRGEEVAEIEETALSSGAQFYEFYLATHKEHAIQRLLDRGTWGESGTPPLTKEDLATITNLYDRMEDQLQKRPNQINIEVEEGNPEATYQKILGCTLLSTDSTHIVAL